MAKLTSAPPMLGSAPPMIRSAPARSDPFYRSSEWAALRSRRMRDPDYAAAKARALPGERLILDHKIERKDGGADLDPTNTEWLTHSEHQAKTARTKRRRAGLG